MSTYDQDHVNRYTSAEACAAAGITLDTLKNWVSRQPQVILLTRGERDAVEAGGGLLFSFQRIMQIALTAKIARTGLKPREAAMIAAGFTDVGDGPLNEIPQRDPCRLFDEGLTVLAWYPGEIAGRVMNLRPEQTRLFELFWFEGTREEASAVIVNRVYDRVRASLPKP